MRVSKLGAVAAMACATALTVLVGPSAQAAQPSNGYIDALTLVGSDTIQDVDSALVPLYNREASNTDSDQSFNVPAFFTGSVTVPGDRSCGPKTYAQTPTGTQVQSPAGSGAGKTALSNSAAAGDGCVDIARSSSGRGSADPSTFQYYAFAKDALSWSASASGNAPAGITLDQLRAIYSCSVTDWSAVGGKAGPIQRYIPQAGSGTRSFFITTVLANQDPTATSSASCPAVKVVNENAASEISSADAASAIFPFSAAQWIAQANAVSLPNGTVVADKRGGFTVRSIGGQNPVVTSGATAAPDTTVYNDSAFIGSRNVYHVLDTRSPSYNEALRAVGFDSAGASALCSGRYSATLAKFGFAPLGRGTPAQGTFCRLS